VGGPRIIKKYGNRRLYDTRDSRYINLDELLDLAAVEEVSVLDAASGEDLSERTLTHALLSGDRQDPLVPTQLLRALLQYRKGPRRSDFARHMSRAVASFAKRR
jgi:polyhydroxyalkanoate synthesis repressor PhaR